jgi:hypothetical protein
VVNLERRLPQAGCAKDQSYVQCIRRASLDAMAGKAKNTFEAYVRQVKENNIVHCATNGDTNLAASGSF